MRRSTVVGHVQTFIMTYQQWRERCGRTATLKMKHESKHQGGGPLVSSPDRTPPSHEKRRAWAGHETSGPPPLLLKSHVNLYDYVILGVLRPPPHAWAEKKGALVCAYSVFWKIERPRGMPTSSVLKVVATDHALCGG